MGVTMKDFDAAWSLIETAERVEKIAPRGSKYDLLQEMTEGARADYYLVQCYPGQDVKALRWLSRRRFAVFQPVQQRYDRTNPDKKYEGFEPAFPGWLFVFCWDIDKMQRRILATPGVMALLRDPVSEKPVAIDQGFIDELLGLAWVYDKRATPRSHARVNGTRRLAQVKHSTAKLGRKERKQLGKLKAEAMRVGLWDKAAWDDANRLEPGQRIRLLMAELEKHRRCGWPSLGEGS